MRALVASFAVSLLSLFWVGVAHAAGGETVDSQQQSTQDACYAQPDCAGAWAGANCPHCLRQGSSVSSGTRITIETPYGPVGGDDWQVTQAAQVQLLIDELVSEFPQPSLERGRALAKIFGDNGFLLPQTEILMRVVADSGFMANLEDVATIQRNYALLGWSDIAVDYGEWINERFSAYDIDTSRLTAIPGLPPIYVDPYPNLRRQVLENNAEAYASAQDTANAVAAQMALEALEQQMETSPFENIVVIVEASQ